MTFEYRNLSELGNGGFAMVWLCERIPDGSRFAKKVLRDDASSKTLERFRQEVSILSRLDHTNIVKIVDSDLAGPIIWYTMPIYRTSLQSELDTVIGHEERIRPIFSAILDAVEYAHTQQVLHRDLKPHNVLLNSDAEVVVSDFGIGRVLDADGDRVTRTGARMGSTLYMSPEQSTDSKHVDHRADVYSLGRMLYELYTERLNSAVQTLPRLPPHISSIVERCTEYSADKRYQSVSQLKTAWHEVLHVPENAEAESEARRLVEELTATPEATGKLRQLLSYLVRTDTPRTILRTAFSRLPAPRRLRYRSQTCSIRSSTPGSLVF